jgi:hypothetical protein
VRGSGERAGARRPRCELGPSLVLAQVSGQASAIVRLLILTKLGLVDPSYL